MSKFKFIYPAFEIGSMIQTRTSLMAKIKIKPELVKEAISKHGNFIVGENCPTVVVFPPKTLVTVCTRSVVEELCSEATDVSDMEFGNQSFPVDVSDVYLYEVSTDDGFVFTAFEYDLQKIEEKAKPKKKKENNNPPSKKTKKAIKEMQAIGEPGFINAETNSTENHSNLNWWNGYGKETHCVKFTGNIEKTLGKIYDKWASSEEENRFLAFQILLYHDWLKENDTAKEHKKFNEDAYEDLKKAYDYKDNAADAETFVAFLEEDVFA